MIDHYLKSSVNLPDQSIHLLYSANRWEKHEEIKQKLLEGVTIISDRYAFSGVAFSMAKGMDKNWCKNPDRGLLRPDLLMFLNVSPEVAESRPGFGEERYEVSEFQRKVTGSFRELQREDPSSWTIIDAEKTFKEVQDEILEIALPVVESVKEKPLLPLWLE